MNTPKLLSVLSSSIGNAAQARLGKAADPAHGLDFSQLLGERRDASVAAVTGRASYTEQSNRSADRVADRNNGSQPARAKPAQNEQAPNNRNERDTQPVARQNTAPAERDSKENGAAPANTTANDNVVSRPNDPSANAQNESGNAQPGQQPGAQGSTDAAPTDAELAQNAAETGVAAAVATQHVDPALALAAAESEAAVRTVSLPAAATGLTAQAQQNPASLTGVNAAAQALAAVAGVTEEGAEAVAPQAQNPDQQAQNVAARGIAQAGNGAFPPAGMAAAQAAPATPAASNELAALVNGAATAAASPEPAAATPAAGSQNTNPAAQGLPAFNLVDTSGTAAARSLQEFTAMVAAARATSGTALPVNAAAAPAVPSAATLPGMMPAGMFGSAPLAQSLTAGPAVAAPLGSPQWSTEFGQQFIRIAQAATGMGQVAELRLDPPELGPLRITINLNDNVVQAVFSSPHAAVRQTVENALPQLQQMLEQAGISLGQANVNDQGQAGQGFNGEARRSAQNGTTESGSNAGGIAQADGHGSATHRPADPNALVDTFA